MLKRISPISAYHLPSDARLLERGKNGNHFRTSSEQALQGHSQCENDKLNVALMPKQVAKTLLPRRATVIELCRYTLNRMYQKFICTLASIALVLVSHGMSDVKVFTIAGNVYELDLTDSTEKGIVKVPIEIWSGDQKITAIESGPKGKYKVDLAYYPSYTLRFGASPYVTKIIEIQTDGVHRAAEFGIVNLDLDITLFRDQNYMGLDFMTYTPIAKAAFNKKKGQLVWDQTYGDAMNVRVRGVIAANAKK